MMDMDMDMVDMDMVDMDMVDTDMVDMDMVVSNVSQIRQDYLSFAQLHVV